MHCIWSRSSFYFVYLVNTCSRYLLSFFSSLLHCGRCDLPVLHPLTRMRLDSMSSFCMMLLAVALGTCYLFSSLLHCGRCDLPVLHPITRMRLDILITNDHLGQHTRVKVKVSILTQVKVHGAVRARYGPMSKQARNAPVFLSLNISTFHSLRTHNSPIIFIIFTGPL